MRVRTALTYIRNSTDLEYMIEILDVWHGFGVISLRKGYHRRSSGEWLPRRITIHRITLAHIFTRASYSVTTTV